jgi:hypothetical protein
VWEKLSIKSGKQRVQVSILPCAFLFLGRQLTKVMFQSSPEKARMPADSLSSPLEEGSTIARSFQPPAFGFAGGEGTGEEEIMGGEADAGLQLEAEEGEYEGQEKASAKPRKKPANGPSLSYTQVEPATAGKNGRYKWKVKWTLPGATDKTNGWIIQKLVAQQNVTDKNGKPIQPGSGNWGGFPANKTPYWEAWQVRKGKVFVGGTDLPHKADTFAQNEIGPQTKGKTVQWGDAAFYPNLKLPASMVQQNDLPAGILPATKSDPGLGNGTGKIQHGLTAQWNSVQGDGTTKINTF